MSHGWRRLAVPLVALALAVGCASDEERVDEHLERAEEYEALGQDREAALELRNALKLAPQSAPISYRIALLSERMGGLSDALFFLSETRRLDPEHSEAALAEANLVRSDDPQRAEELIQGVLEREPENVMAWIRLSDLELTRGRVRVAQRHVQKALEIAPDSYRTHLQNGIYLRARARNIQLRDDEIDDDVLAEALAAFEGAIERMDDETPPELRVRGWLERARVLASWPERRSEADAAFHRAAEVAAEQEHPTDLRIGVYHATLEVARGGATADRRRWALEGLIAADPSSMHAWLQLARLEASGGGDELAVMERLLEARPDDAHAHSLYARTLARNERPEDARAHLIETAEKTRNPEALLATLADLQFAAGELEALRQTVDRMDREAPDSQHTRFARAQLAYFDGRSQEALDHLQSLPNADVNLRVQQLIADAEFRLGRPDRALGALNRALVLAPEEQKPRLLRARARAEMAQGDAPAAARSLRRVWALRGNRLRAEDVVLLARALYESGEPDLARRQLEALLEREEEPPAMAVLVFARFEGERQPERARALLEEAAAKSADPRILEHLVRADLRAERRDEAVARVDEALASAGPQPSLLMLRARVELAQGDLEAAAESAREALDLQPELPGGAAFLAQVLNRQGKLEEALATLEVQARVGSLDTDAALLLARLHSAEANDARAIELFEQVLANRAELPGALNDLAYLLLKTGGDQKRALELAQEAQNQLPESADVADTLALAYLENGLTEPARRQILYALELAESEGQVRPDFHYHHGLALRALGEDAEAVLAFERALAPAVDFDGIEEARSTLAELRAASNEQAGEGSS